MGIVGLILGILGTISSFFPVIVFGAWLFSLIGIFVSANAMKKGEGGIAIAGLVLSIVGLVLAIPRLICAIACASAINDFNRGMGAW